MEDRGWWLCEERQGVGCWETANDKEKDGGGADVESDDEDIAHFSGISTDASDCKKANSEDHKEEQARKKQKINGVMEVKVEIKPKKESNDKEFKRKVEGQKPSWRKSCLSPFVQTIAWLQIKHLKLNKEGEGEVHLKYNQSNFPIALANYVWVMSESGWPLNSLVDVVAEAQRRNTYYDKENYRWAPCSLVLSYTGQCSPHPSDCMSWMSMKGTQYISWQSTTVLHSAFLPLFQRSVHVLVQEKPYNANLIN